MGRSATLPDHARSLWGTSPADAGEGVETSCGKGGSLPPSPHFHPMKRAESLCKTWHGTGSGHHRIPSVSTFPGLVWSWFINVVAQQHLCVAFL